MAATRSLGQQPEGLAQRTATRHVVGPAPRQEPNGKVPPPQSTGGQEASQPESRRRKAAVIIDLELVVVGVANGFDRPTISRLPNAKSNEMWEGGPLATEDGWLC